MADGRGCGPGGGHNLAKVGAVRSNLIARSEFSHHINMLSGRWKFGGRRQHVESRAKAAPIPSEADFELEWRIGGERAKVTR